MNPDATQPYCIASTFPTSLLPYLRMVSVLFLHSNRVDIVVICKVEGIRTNRDAGMGERGRDMYRKATA